MNGRRALGAVVALAATAAVLWWWATTPSPGPVVRETVVWELDAAPAGTAMRLDVLEPVPFVDGRGGRRRALVGTPPSAAEVALDVPDGTMLRGAVGIAGAGVHRETIDPVRFRVVIDGDTAHEVTLDPRRRPEDGRWVEVEVDLARWAGRQVLVRLEAHGPDARLAGWSGLRLVHRMPRPRVPASPAAPNVLVLLVDTLRADVLGAYGAAPSPTPTLDALAREGVVFDQVMAAAPWTMPSVASLITGRYPSAHGVLGGAQQWGLPADVPPGADWSVLTHAIPTFAELAQEAGITTYGVSTNPAVARGTNLGRGFETFEELGPADGDARWADAAAVNEAFLDWAAGHREWRFLAYLHYMDVHGPYGDVGDAPPAPAGVRPQVAAGDPPRIRRHLRRGGPALTATEVAHLHALYRADLVAWDTELARLLAGLAELGLDRSTVVIVTADHGEELFEHGWVGHGSHLYEESIRVPLIVRGPGIAPGRDGRQVAGVDVMPTVLARLGVTPPSGLPGHDLLAPAAEGRGIAFAETRFGRRPDGTAAALLAARTPEWKLIRFASGDGTELYHLPTDPAERTNRVDDGDGTLAAALAEWLETTPKAEAASPIGDAAIGDRLRALGYAE
jgi:choline-sulfatase